MSGWNPQARPPMHLAELLLGQGDQRRGVVGHLAGVQGLEHAASAISVLPVPVGVQTSTPCSAENQASRASSWIG